MENEQKFVELSLAEYTRLDRLEKEIAAQLNDVSRQKKAMKRYLEEKGVLRGKRRGRPPKSSTV